MATILRKIKLREVSMVEDPASPGANFILMKGLDSEPRDDHGRWTSLGAAGRAVRTASRLVAAPVRELSSHARTLRLNDLRPVYGGGIDVGLTSKNPRGRSFYSHIQLRPEHFDNFPLNRVPNGKRALIIATQAAIAAGRPQIARRSLKPMADAISGDSISPKAVAVGLRAADMATAPKPRAPKARTMPAMQDSDLFGKQRTNDIFKSQAAPQIFKQKMLPAHTIRKLW